MKPISKNKKYLLSGQAGFSVVELLVISVAVCLIVSVGWLVWSHDHKKTGQPSPVQSVSGQGTRAEALVSHFYKLYASAKTASERLSLVQQYGTTALANSYSETDSAVPFVCSPPATSVVATRYIISKGLVRVTAHQTATPGKSFPITVVNNGSLRIDTIGC